MAGLVTLTISETGYIAPTLSIQDGQGSVVLSIDNGLNSPVTLTVTDSRGETGKSAYQTWIDLGNAGTEAQFLSSLVITTNAGVSLQPNNRLQLNDDGLYVLDDFAPDPLAYYILARS